MTEHTAPRSPGCARPRERNVGPVLLVVEPDSHYIKYVSNRALGRGLIGRVVVADRTDFNDKLAGLREARPAVAADGARSGRGIIIAKGMIETADFLRLVLRYNDKELIAGGADGFLSHCAILIRKMQWLLGREKPIILTDAALNIAPDAEQKIRIVKNAVDLARRALGVGRPVVAVLTAAGKYNAADGASVDGQHVIDSLGDENAEIRLDQVDTAVDAESRRIKKLDGGAADILLADRIIAGQAVYKMATKKAWYEAVGFLCGTTVPVALTSRGDSARSKLLSIEYAARMLGAQR
jgi:phosphate butyryltransferase